MRMAYVEDDKQIQQYMSLVLKSFGIEVFQFLAPSLLEKDKPSGLDLILTDGTMLNGETALDTLTCRKLYYPETPLWLYSGNYDFVNTFRTSSFKAYEKPTDLTKLLKDLKEFKGA